MGQKGVRLLSDTGYIKLYRKLLDNPVVCKDTEHLAVWIYLLLNATHKKYKVMFEGKVIELYPGQLITSRKTLVKQFYLSESKVQRILKTLEIEQQIEQQTTRHNRLITVLNWSDYQESEQQIEQQLNNNRTTTEQQLNTNKNDKNVKNVKNDKNTTSKTLDLSFVDSKLADSFAEYVEYRKSLKKPMTQLSAQKAYSGLLKLSSNVADQIAIIDQTIEKGWIGLFELKAKSPAKTAPKYRPSNIGNFVGRDYSDAELNGFYEPVEVVK